MTPGWVSDNAFLAGYGAAQAVPGPLFTFAAYLGAIVRPSPHGVAGAALGLVGIFLPGMLILARDVAVLGHFPHACGRAGRNARRQCCGRRSARRRPLQSGLDEFRDDAGRFRHRAARLCLLTVWRAPPLLVVIVSAIGAIALAFGA